MRVSSFVVVHGIVGGAMVLVWNTDSLIGGIFCTASWVR